MLRLSDSCQIKESTDQYHVTISRVQVQSQLRWRGVAWFLFSEIYRWPVIGVSIWLRAQARLILWRTWGEYVQGKKFGANLALACYWLIFRHNPCAVVSWKVPYISYVISTILGKLIEYSLLKLNCKKEKPHTKQWHAYNWSFLWVSDPDKSNPIFFLFN